MKSLTTTVAVVVTSLLLTTTGLAQSDVPRYMNVVILKVKADMRGEWESLQKEYVAAMKKGGFPSRNVWQVVRGDTNEYHILTRLEKFADLDESRPVMGEVDLARWIARVTKCVASRRVHTLEYLSNLSIPAHPERKPRFAELIFAEIAPGRGADFTVLREKEMLPAYKKGGFDGLYVHRVRFGDSSGLWTIARFADSWADFDGPGPLQRGLSEEGYESLVSKLNEVTVRRGRLVVRHRPDLSYRPE